jgi:hypothetical protein
MNRVRAGAPPDRNAGLAARWNARHIFGKGTL